MHRTAVKLPKLEGADVRITDMLGFVGVAVALGDVEECNVQQQQQGNSGMNSGTRRPDQTSGDLQTWQEAHDAVCFHTQKSKSVCLSVPLLARAPSPPLSQFEEFAGSACVKALLI